MPKQKSDQLESHFDEKLDQAYRRTHYRVDGFYLRVDEETPDFREWLHQNDIDSYALITAWNPRSTLLATTINQQRNDQLQEVLDIIGLSYRLYLAEDPTGEWPTEHGFFVENPSEEQVFALARDFNQNAILSGAVDRYPKVHWV